MKRFSSVESRVAIWTTPHGPEYIWSRVRDAAHIADFRYDSDPDGLQGDYFGFEFWHEHRDGMF